MKKILCFLIVLLMSVMMSGIGIAAIVQWEDTIDGFQDTDTGLYWIDPINFVDVDYEEWLETNAGWDLATFDQLFTLLFNLGLNLNFWNAMGDPTAIDEDIYTTTIYYEGAMMPVNENDAVSISLISFEGGGMMYGMMALDSSSDDFHDTPGAWIVSANQEPVPEPATLFLLGSGLVGLAGLGRKYKN